MSSQEGRFEKRWKKTFDEMQVLKAEWLITRRCDLKCSYCRIIDDTSLKGRPELTTEQLIDAVKLFAEQWPGAPMIVYGGEPTIRDDLPELIRAGRDYGVKLPVISNSLRVMRDKEYRERLIAAGLDNWSVSFDGLHREHFVDLASGVKSDKGINALLMFRDQYGLRDLVACVTVTKWNIESLPTILRFLTGEGIHGIFTPLHIGGPGYEYGQGHREDMPSQEQLDEISPQMYEMVKSGRFLCSNDAAWFNVWPEHFLLQDWMCNDKGLITIDADGSLKYCVDIPFREEDTMFIWELATEEGQKKFLDVIQKGPSCHGCLWNPAYECIKRARDPEIGIEEGRKRSRHHVAPDRWNKLFGGAGRYFIDNADLKRLTTQENEHARSHSSNSDDRES